MMSNELPENAKFMPVNLTAGATQWIKGNSSGTRPESGVDNSFPGLEFDQRNIDRYFFSGLEFEFHRSEGAALVGTSQSGLSDLFRKLLSSSGPNYLWAIAGTFNLSGEKPGSEPLDTDQLSLHGLGGLEVWRRIHHVLPGRIAIVIGPGPRPSSATLSSSMRADLNSVFQGDTQSILRENERGELQYAAISGYREEPLDECGVIDPNLIGPGELTKTLCAPWAYDFRDCGCFYWASNKPDTVAPNPEVAEGEGVDYVNYMRRDRAPTPDKIEFDESDRPDLRKRNEAEMTYADFVNGGWEKLPIVLSDHEHGDNFVPDPAPDGMDLTPEQVKAELRYLVSVEHALTVKYLYALYSLKDDESSPEPSPIIRRASKEILEVAIDEMRHFRWANQILSILGEPPSVSRARIIGSKPSNDSSRPVMDDREYLDKPFELSVADFNTLKWFVDIEKPSQVFGQGIDGMYVQILRSIERNPSEYEASEKIIEIIKLIIDEGEQHYQRFSNVLNELQALGEPAYLRGLDGVPSELDKKIMLLGDLYYEGVLRAMQVNFSLGPAATGNYLRAAVRSMFSLHEIGLELGRRNLGLPFTIPVLEDNARLEKEECREVTRDIGDRVNQVIGEITNDQATPESFGLALNGHRSNYAELINNLQNIIDEEYST